MEDVTSEPAPHVMRTLSGDAGQRSLPSFPVAPLRCSIG